MSLCFPGKIYREKGLRLTFLKHWKLNISFIFLLPSDQGTYSHGPCGASRLGLAMGKKILHCGSNYSQRTMILRSKDDDFKWHGLIWSTYLLLNSKLWICYSHCSFLKSFHLTLHDASSKGAMQKHQHKMRTCMLRMGFVFIQRANRQPMASVLPAVLSPQHLFECCGGPFTFPPNPWVSSTLCEFTST